MSVNKFYRQRWCDLAFDAAVKDFHLARKHPDNADEALSDIARKCANTVFADRAQTIVGDRETIARLFMATCRERFPAEIHKALIETPEKEELAA